MTKCRKKLWTEDFSKNKKVLLENNFCRYTEPLLAGRDTWTSPSSTCTPGNQTGVPALHGLSSPQGNFTNHLHFPFSFVCGDWNDPLIAIATGKPERQQIRNDRKARTTGKLEWRKDRKSRNDRKVATTWMLAAPVYWRNECRYDKYKNFFQSLMWVQKSQNLMLN